MAYGGSQARCLTGATAASPCQSHSNARSQATSWFLVGFTSAVPQWELPKINILYLKVISYKRKLKFLCKNSVDLLPAFDVAALIMQNTD